MDRVRNRSAIRTLGSQIPPSSRLRLLSDSERRARVRSTSAWPPRRCIRWNISPAAKLARLVSRQFFCRISTRLIHRLPVHSFRSHAVNQPRSEEHTSELQSPYEIV